MSDVAAKMSAFAPEDAQSAGEAEDLAGMGDRFEARQVTEADAKYLYQRSCAASTSRARTAETIARKKGRDPR